MKRYGQAEPFLYSLFNKFDVKDTFEFFEKKGLPLVVQARQRVFPKTERAADVVRVLEEYMKQGRVEIKTSLLVTKIEASRGKITAVYCGQEKYEAKDYLLATGSLSHPETGSTGDGFGWLRALGHTVIKPTPTIVPLAVKERWVKDLAGVSLSFMKITFFADGIKKFSLTGKILFTHFGLSGPLILNSAYKVADLLKGGAIVTAEIDAYPQTDLGSIEKNLIKIFEANKNKILKNMVKDFIPEGMDKGILMLVDKIISVETKVHSIKKEDRKRLVRLLKALPLTIESLMGFDRAVIADGGVPLNEIDLKTMRSTKISNLLITGDLLHVNRPSGGYSLQLCWSSGYVAGEQV
jgi:predicted Rossmann fold flavoprotein